MAIARIQIENYRSIENLTLPFGELNALVGSNNAGKSNILKALNIILGETWPTKPFTERDFFGGDLNRAIAITVIFDRPLASDNAVGGFRLTYDLANDLDYFAVDLAGNPVPGYRGGVKRISRDMRSEVALLYVGLNREATDQIRATQWTLYGKLLRQIEQGIADPVKQQFSTDVATAVATHIQAHLTQAEAEISDFIQQQTGLSVQLAFRLLSSLEVLRSVRPYVIEGALHTDPEDVGAGVQSALAIGIAKAYAEIVRQPLMLAIEEPELFLHPHGCRNFFRLLKELAAPDLQIVYTTHERAFVDAGEYQAINIVRKGPRGTTVTTGSSVPFAATDRLKLQTRFDDRLNEVFFASCVVLCESEPDEIACRCALQSEGVDLDRDSISVIGVGGINEVQMVAELLSGFGIPTICVTDEDPGNAVTARTRTGIERIIGNANSFLQQPNLEGLFGLAAKPRKVDAMAQFSARMNAPGSAPEVYRDIIARVRAIAV